MEHQGHARHLAAPRTLLFLERDGRWLLLEGAAHKWWAGRWNGLGGSVEPGEDVLAAARREALEETGLEVRALELAAVVHVRADPAVLLFVFAGRLPVGDPVPSREGAFRWLVLDDLARSDLPLMPDLPVLLPIAAGRAAGDPPRFLVIDHRDARPSSP